MLFCLWGSLCYVYVLSSEEVSDATAVGNFNHHAVIRVEPYRNSIEAHSETDRTV